MRQDVQRILIDRRRIARRVRSLAEQITRDLQRETGRRAGTADLELTLVPILTGSVVFLADLVRHLPWRMRLNMVSISSYPGAATRSQGVSLGQAMRALPQSLAGTHVLVVDDILDSGRTLKAVTRALQRRRPASLRTCVLLRKAHGREHRMSADYVGFDVPDEFVVGYGLDFNGYYRNLPEIVTLKPGVIRRAQPGTDAEPRRKRIRA